MICSSSPSRKRYVRESPRFTTASSVAATSRRRSHEREDRERGSHPAPRRVLARHLQDRCRWRDHRGDDGVDRAPALGRTDSVERVDRHLRGDLAGEVTTHAVRHGEHSVTDRRTSPRSSCGTRPTCVAAPDSERGVGHCASNTVRPSWMRSPRRNGRVPWTRSTVEVRAVRGPEVFDEHASPLAR